MLALSALLALVTGLLGYHLAGANPALATAAPMPIWTDQTVGPTTPPTNPPPVTGHASPAPATPSPLTAPPRSVATRVPVAPHPVAVAAGDFGCAAALAYVAAHQAPGFVDLCRPHAASGGYGYTCVDHAPQCPGMKVIAIACPAPIVYKNEASNSLVLAGRSQAAIDPFGQNDPRCPAYA
jgi:hypothetical protein